MEILKEIANVSGKSGLYRILKPSRSGVIVESLDGKKEKTMIGASARVSVLQDVSIFVGSQEDSVALSKVFMKIKEIHGDKVPLDVKLASDKDLIEFMSEVLPDFDRDRVYVSDIKKIITWFNTISENFPDAFVEQEAPKKTLVATQKSKEATTE